MLSAHRFALRPALFCLALLAAPAAATVGGDDTLEVLGYEAAANKVYLLRHYEDGRGGYNLYYFDLSARQPERLVRVRSFYHPASGQDPDGIHARADDDDAFFAARLAHLQKRLRPLSAVNPSAVTLHLDGHSVHPVPAWDDTREPVPVTEQRYHLSYGPYRSAPAAARIYRDGLSVTQAYRLPGRQGYIAAVRYVHTDFETGYRTEEMHLLQK